MQWARVHPRSHRERASYRLHAFARLLRRLGLRHKRMRPCTPRTKGNAERFIQAALPGWAYAGSYDHSDQRAAYLNPWLHEYSWPRLHASRGYPPPISRIPGVMNNLLDL